MLRVPCVQCGRWPQRFTTFFLGFVPFARARVAYLTTAAGCKVSVNTYVRKCVRVCRSGGGSGGSKGPVDGGVVGAVLIFDGRGLEGHVVIVVVAAAVFAN